MSIYFSPYQLPELHNLTAEQRAGVVRRFFGDRFFVFAGLAGGIGLGVGYILSDVLNLSYWHRAFLIAALSLCGSFAFGRYEMKRLRSKIADYIFIHFSRKPV